MKAYQLKIMIKNSKPPIWRRATVPSGLTFSQLSLVLNEIMGWSGGHLSSFEFKSMNLRIEEQMDDFFMTDALDATSIIIDEFLDEAEWFSYIYDFGDWWDHRVTVEKIIDDYPYGCPRVLKIKGETPPEDCGGIHGYYLMQDALGDAEHPDHDMLSDWYDMMCPEEADLEFLNDKLKTLYLTEAPHLPMGRVELYEAMWDGEPLKRIVTEDEWEQVQNGEFCQAATMEEWSKLYDVTNRIHALEPWKDLWDVDLIEFASGVIREPVYMSIMGHAGNCYGICVYEGIDTLHQFMMTKCQEQLNIPQEVLMYKQNALVAYWGDREELSKEQHQRIKEMGYRYRGKNQWLYFLSFKEGFWPCDLNGAEVSRMTRYMELLENILLNSRQELVKVDFEHGKIACVDVFGPDPDEVVEGELPLIIRAIPELHITDEVLMEKLKKRPGCACVLEAEIIVPQAAFHAPGFDRPINAALCLLVDHETGMILMHELVEPGEDPWITMADALANFMLDEAVPKEVHVSNDLMAATLRHICMTAGTKVIRQDVLSQITEIAKELPL